MKVKMILPALTEAESPLWRTGRAKLTATNPLILN